MVEAVDCLLASGHERAEQITDLEKIGVSSAEMIFAHGDVCLESLLDTIEPLFQPIEPFGMGLLNSFQSIEPLRVGFLDDLYTVEPFGVCTLHDSDLVDLLGELQHVGTRANGVLGEFIV
jgi:hypothetical protein